MVAGALAVAVGIARGAVAGCAPARAERRHRYPVPEARPTSATMPKRTVPRDMPRGMVQGRDAGAAKVLGWAVSVYGEPLNPRGAS